MKAYEAKVMLVMCVPAEPTEQNAARIDAALLDAGYCKDRLVMAACGLSDDDVPDDTTLFLMQEIGEQKH